MTDSAKKASPRVQHVASIQQLPEGGYRVGCDACAFSRRGILARNAAYDLAYMHTLNQGAA